jgi:hypothetical protein
MTEEIQLPSMAEILAFDPMAQLEADLRAAVAYRVYNSPRSLQKELGPSEVGHPCPRRIAFGLMAAPEVAPRFDPLPSAVGTGGHDFFGGAFEMDNERIGEQRWLVEDRVNPFGSTEGNSDLFCTRYGTVVDHKFLGLDKIKHARKHGPRRVYINQVQTYGLGQLRKGRRVERVAIWMLPRGGLLADAYLWSAPFDPKIAEWVDRRLATITALCVDLDVEHHPERFQDIPLDTSDCSFCGWKVKHPVAGPHCIPPTKKKAEEPSIPDSAAGETAEPTTTEGNS